MRMCLMAHFTSCLHALLFIYPPAATLDYTVLHCIVLYPQRQCEAKVYSILLISRVGHGRRVYDGV